MLKRNLLQWAENSWYIQSLETALWKATKTIDRRRKKNAFDRYRVKVNEIKREEYVVGKVRWFEQVRNKKTAGMVYDAWQAYVRRFKSGKTFLLRSI